jgi:hypothetical protein
MRVQHSRTDVLPLTWEIPTTIGLVWVVLAVAGLPAGQALAYGLSGLGARWPEHLPEALGGLLAGRPGIGVPGGTPALVVVYGAIVLVELIVTGLGVWATSWWWRSTGPGAQYGLASPHEVRAVLGERELNRRRGTIRPDLTARQP